MNRLFFCLILFAFTGCSNPQPPAGEIVAKVGSYIITRQEFEEAYKDSNYGALGTIASRKLFLDNMINQKLILLDAEKRNLDKSTQFLKMIENFWQQSLLTTAMQEKSLEGGDLDKWVDYLRRNTTIEINEELLK